MEDKMTYIMTLAMIVNMTFGVIGSYTQSGQASIDSFFNQTEAWKTAQEIKDRQTIAEQPKDLLSRASQTVQQLAEGAVNLILFIIYFFGMIFANIVAVPSLLMAGSSAQERAMGMAIMTVLGFLDFMVIRAGYEFIVNKTRK